MVTHSSIFKIDVFIGCTGFSLLRRLFSRCSKRRLLSSSGVWAFHCSGFSCCRAWAQLAMACGIFMKQGSNQCSLHCKDS